MCDLFSGHIVFSKDKFWGTVLYKSPHHEEDREYFQAIPKYKDCKLLAWQTRKGASFEDGIIFTHVKALDIPEAEKLELEKLVLAWASKQDVQELLWDQRNDKDGYVREAVVNKLTDQDRIYSFKDDKDEYVREAVVNKLTDQDRIYSFKEDKDWYVREVVVNKLTDQDRIYSFKDDKDEYVRIAVNSRLVILNN